MNTDVDLENELLQLVVEELVRAGLRTSLREPILAAVERAPDDPVEVVVPEGPADAPEIEGSGDGAGDEGSADAESGESGRGPIAGATRKLLLFAALATVLYVALRQLTD
jgi:hypothetical protein